MTLSRARDPFAGINHWKRKHIPAATQICQHPTAGESGERAERERERRPLVPTPSRSNERRGRQSQREDREDDQWKAGGRRSERRERVNKREIMTRPRPTGLCVALVATCTHCHESESESWRARERESASDESASERDGRPRGTRCSSVDDSSLPWGARATHTWPRVATRVCAEPGVRTRLVCAGNRQRSHSAPLRSTVYNGPYTHRVCVYERDQHVDPEPALSLAVIAHTTTTTTQLLAARCGIIYPII